MPRHKSQRLVFSDSNEMKPFFSERISQKIFVTNRKTTLKVKESIRIFHFIRTKKPSRFAGKIYDTFNDSELDESDGDDTECNLEPQKRIRVGSNVLTLEDELFVESDSEDDDFEGFSSSDVLLNGGNGNQCDAGIDAEWKWTTKENIKWRKGIMKKPNFEYEEVENDTDDTIVDYFSPLDYFEKYVPDASFNDMVQYTNIYQEIKTFIGLHVMMGNLKLPRIEMFYSRELRIKTFQDTIPLYRFYLLRTALHLIAGIAVRGISVHRRTNDSDERKSGEGCETVRQTQAESEMGNQERGTLWEKWSGDFICYQGSTTEFDPEMLSTFGSGATMVLHLAKRINNSGHKLFFDNYFSTFHLFEVLAQKKIQLAT